MDTPETQGFFPRLGAALFGPRIKRLREQIGQAHWLSYLLIISQSIAVVLVFGHAEVMYLTQPSGLIRALAIGGLFVLIINVIAADMALIDTMLRIPALRRNRQAGALFEHRAYQFFVLAVEGMTYGIVIYALDSDPQALFQGRSLVPTNSLIFLTLVLMRVVLLAWTLTQLIIVREKLPVLLSTLMNTGKEIVGGHLEEQLKALKVQHIDPHALMSVYSEMSRPPRPIRGLLNALTGGWIVNRALAQEAEEERQAANVITALERIHVSQPAEPVISVAVTEPTSVPPARESTAPRLSPHDAKRAAFARQMETDLQEYPLGGADDYGDWDDDGVSFTRQPHVTSPRAKSRSNGHSLNGSSAAQVASRAATLALPDADDGVIRMPTPFEPTDSREGKRVMRYLDKHPFASKAQVVKSLGISEKTVRGWHRTWSDRQSRRGIKAAPMTEEMPAITLENMPSTSEPVEA